MSLIFLGIGAPAKNYVAVFVTTPEGLARRPAPAASRGILRLASRAGAGYEYTAPPCSTFYESTVN
jgi:hypothetical protein